jgi:hypothetical protein
MDVMNKKLSTKERGETVTKGFLVDYLETKEYVTVSRLEEILDSKNYVTKDYLEQTLDTRFNAFQKDMHQHLNALMEHNREQTLILIEAFQGRFERIERHVDLEPWTL